MRSLALGALAAALLVPTSAQASSAFYVRGHGFGHGIGMSQYGAYGLAQHGATAAQILGHYYTGTTLGAVAPTEPVHVLLEVTGRVSFSGATSAGTRHLSAAKTYSAQALSTGTVRLLSPSGRKLADLPAPLSIGATTVRVAGHALNGVSSGTYRGGLVLQPSGSALQVINELGLDDYVRGVVAAEMPSSWAPAALQAQAIAARTYAITTDGSAPLYPDTRSQVYRGIAAEAASTDAAVAATQGQVVEYGGAPVTTYFMSTSGGETENVEDSFLGASPEPWLVSVQDPYDSISPRHTWGPIRMSLTSVGSKLGRLVKGRFRGIVVTQRGHSPRVVKAQIVGSRGRTDVSGPTLRSRLGLYDTWAYFTAMRTAAKQKSTPAPQTSGGPSGGAAPPPATASAALAGRPWIVSGSVSPGRRGTAYALQRLDRGRWTTIAHGRLRRGGTWQATVKGVGRYRIRLGRLAGPGVTVG
jgi:stage II sporulation protein D